VDIFDLAVIRTATAMPLARRVGHDLASFASMAAPLGIVCAPTTIGRPEAVKSTAKSAKILFRVLMAAVLSEPDPDRVIFPRKYTLGLVGVGHQGGERSASAFASMREIDGLKK
jgi:hypothetical protein